MLTVENLGNTEKVNKTVTFRNLPTHTGCLYYQCAKPNSISLVIPKAVL